MFEYVPTHDIEVLVNKLLMHLIMLVVSNRWRFHQGFTIHALAKVALNKAWARHAKVIHATQIVCYTARD